MAKRKDTTRRDGKVRSYDRANKAPTTAITPAEYSGLQAASDHMNAALFESAFAGVAAGFFRTPANLRLRDPFFLNRERSET